MTCRQTTAVSRIIHHLTDFSLSPVTRSRGAHEAPHKRAHDGSNQDADRYVENALQRCKLYRLFPLGQGGVLEGRAMVVCLAFCTRCG